MNRSVAGLFTGLTIAVLSVLSGESAGATPPHFNARAWQVIHTWRLDGAFTLSPSAWDRLTNSRATVFEREIAIGQRVGGTWVRHAESVRAIPFIGICPARCAMPTIAQMRRLRAQIAAIPGPVMIAWYPEANLFGHPREFVRQWLTLHRALAGDRNLIWVWQVSQWRPWLLRLYWPGWRYVDLVGVDAFSYDGSRLGAMITSAVRAIRRFTRQPIFVASTASRVSQRGALRELQAVTRRLELRGFLWFDRHAWTLHAIRVG